jgi:hypothetical protein
MGASFKKIFKQAFILAKGHWFFWVAGLFLVWFTLGRAFIMLLFTAEMFAPEALRAVEEQGRGQAAGAENLWTAGLTLLGIVLLILYYFRAKSFLILSVKQRLEHQQVEPKQNYEKGMTHNTLLFKSGFMLNLLLFFMTALLTSPVFYLINSGYSARAASLGALALVVYLPIFVILYFSIMVCPMFIVVHSMGISDSLRASLDLIRKFWPTLVFFSLSLLVIEVVWFIVTMVLVTAASVPFVLLSGIFYDMGGQAAQNILQGIAGTVGIVVFFLSAAALTAFQRIAWAVAFFEKKTPVKNEDVKAPVTMPEVAS